MASSNRVQSQARVQLENNDATSCEDNRLKKFVHLHLHTEASLLDGLSKNEEVAKRVKELGQEAVAITDHGTMRGCVGFYDACLKEGVKPILGMEAYITPMGHSMSERKRYDIKDLRGKPGHERNNYHLILLAKDYKGYQNLCQLHTLSYERGMYYKPRIDFETLCEHKDGLIVQNACIIGMVNHYLYCDDYDKARETALRFQEAFGEDYYFEIMNHGLPMEMKIMQPMRELAKEIGVKIVATNDSHFAYKHQHKLQKTMMMLGMHKSWSDPDITGSYFDESDSQFAKSVSSDSEDVDPIFEMPAELYIKDYDEMLEAIRINGGEHGVAEQELANTLEVANKCNIELPIIDSNDMKAYHMPKYDITTDFQYDDYEKEKDSFEIRQSTQDAIIKEMKQADPDCGDSLDEVLDEHELSVLKFLCWLIEKGMQDRIIPKLKTMGKPLPMETWCKNPPKGFQIKHTHLSPDETYLQNEAKQGKTYDDMLKEYHDRVDYELSVVCRKGFIDYFAIVQDYCNFTKKNGGQIGAGRGSGAGSLLNYLIGITSIDPITNKLLFFRFLNPDRNAVPDIDVDFSQEFREGRLKPYLKEKYGKRSCASIATFGYAWGKAAIRAAARVLFNPPDSVRWANDLCDLLPDKPPSLNLNDVLESEGNDAFKKKARSAPHYRQIVKLALDIQGRLMTVGIHASAFIVSPWRIDDKLPMEVTKEARESSQKTGEPIHEYVIAYDHIDTMEKLGYVKMDLLCLKDLESLQRTVDTIERVYGAEIDIEKIPLDDAAVFDMLADDNVAGIFQLDGSAGMSRVMNEVKPQSIEEINAVIALYRPGPMDYIPDYVKGKWHPETISYIDDRLKPILQDTYSVCVYQEQAMLITQAIANFTGGQADSYRKFAAKKKPEKLATLKEDFIKGALANNTSENVAETLWEQLVKFGSYAFNRSHSASYAAVAYRGAFLKAHFPECFLSSMCTVKPEMKGDDRKPVYLQEARSLGVKIRPPHVNYSMEEFDVPEKGVIAFGLGGIKNVGNGAKPIIEERLNHGEYKDFNDFLVRAPREVSKSVLESLAYCGALDGLGWTRKAITASLDGIVDFRKNYFKEMQKKDMFADLLFSAPGGFEDPIAIEVFPPFDTEYTDKQLSRLESEWLGMHFSYDPQDFYRLSRFIEAKSLSSETPTTTVKRDKQYDYVNLSMLGALEDGHKVKFIANVSSCHQFLTKKGDMMAFINVWDNGVLEESRNGFAPRKYQVKCTVFPKTWAKTLAPQKDHVVVIEGKINIDKTGKYPKSVIVNSIMTLPEDSSLLASSDTVKMTEYAQDMKELDSIAKLLSDPGSRAYDVMKLTFNTLQEATSFEEDERLDDFRSKTQRILLSLKSDSTYSEVIHLKNSQKVAIIASQYGGIASRAKLPKAERAIERTKMFDFEKKRSFFSKNA